MSYTVSDIRVPIGENLIVKESRLGGRGVFAVRDISAGAVVYDLAGKLVTKAQCIVDVLTLRARIDDPLSVSEDEYLLLDWHSNSFNHSCEPNVGIRGRTEMFALRPIRLGEEIEFDYSVTVPPNMFTSLWSMKCSCGSEHCRLKIGNLSTISDGKLSAYLEAGAIQDHAKNWLRTHKPHLFPGP